MLGKIKKILIVLCCVLICYFVFDKIKQIYYFKQTENIYQEFERVFVNHDFNDYNKCLRTDVENIIYDISQYGNNYVCDIKEISNNISGEKGYLKYRIETMYYDLDSNVIYNCVYYDSSIYILIKKVNDIWEVYDICSEQGYHDRLVNGHL